MENIDRVVLAIEEEMADIKKKMRKLRDQKRFSSNEFIELDLELKALSAAWDILT